MQQCFVNLTAMSQETSQSPGGDQYDAFFSGIGNGRIERIEKCRQKWPPKCSASCEYPQTRRKKKNKKKKKKKKMGSVLSNVKKKPQVVASPFSFDRSIECHSPENEGLGNQKTRRIQVTARRSTIMTIVPFVSTKKLVTNYSEENHRLGESEFGKLLSLSPNPILDRRSDLSISMFLSFACSL